MTWNARAKSALSTHLGCVLWVAAVCLGTSCGGNKPEVETDQSTSSPDGGGALGDRVSPPLSPGKVIKAPDDEWTWVDFPDTRCMDDSPTGLGIRLHEKSDKLLIMIQGGGACFNTTTCFATVGRFGEDDLPQQVTRGLLDETDATNPFRHWNKVFIPYCSGDIFSGMALDKSGYNGRTQAGYLNIRHYLKRLVPTFKDASRVVLSGQSAGGFAASINWIQAIEAWDGVRVDVLNDSGPPMGEKYLTQCLQRRLAELWKWDSNLPEACTKCDIQSGHVTEPVMRFSVAHTKRYRHALVSSTEDSIIKLFYGYGQDECANLDSLTGSFPRGLYFEGLQDLQNNIFGKHPNSEVYIIDDTRHVWTNSSPGGIESHGVVFSDWLEDFLNPKSDWESVLPE